MSLVAGIDLAAGRGITEVALLTEDDPPRYRADLTRPVTTDAEIVALLSAASPRLIAIDAPLSLPASVHAALLGHPLPEVERIYTRAAERDPVWSRLGVRPLPVSFLGGLTMRALVLVARLRLALPATLIIEVFPTATLRALGLPPPPSRKTTPAARVAARDLLALHIRDLPGDADPPGADLLDALAAAYTAWLHQRGATLLVGDATEGQMVLPHTPQTSVR